MAIERVAVPTPTAPLGLADYQAILARGVSLGMALTMREPVDGSTIPEGTVLYVGGVLYKATSDTAITGTASNYVKITPSGATASAAFVANLTGVTWNKAHGGYYDVSGNLYLFDESLAVFNGVITSRKTLLSTRNIFLDRPHGMETRNSGTSWTVPTGVYFIKVTCIGGGGGGAGGSVADSRCGSGGGSGGISIGYLTVTPLQVINYIIGGGGAGGTPGNPCTAGGDTSFDTIVGYGAVQSLAYNRPGYGGTGTYQYGFTGKYSPSDPGGDGGGPGGGTGGDPDAPGNPGRGYGAGGGGGGRTGSGFSGGAGFKGAIIIEW